MSGYLFKRASNAFKSWSRRWFILRDNRIVYQSESKAEVRTSPQQAKGQCDPLWCLPALRTTGGRLIVSVHIHVALSMSTIH